jgi:hypothetical protein
MQWFHDHPWMTFVLSFMLIASFNNLVSSLTRISNTKNKNFVDDEQ